MPTTDRQMWDALSSHSAAMQELNYLTYSIYAFEKYDWAQDFEKREGRQPSSQEIDQWISQITDHRIVAWRETAARLFDAAAKVYMAGEIDRQKNNAVEQSILNEIKAVNQTTLNEIKRATVWWKQIGAALITAIVAPLIIGIIIVAARSYDLFMPTSTDVSNKLQTQPSHENQQPGLPQKPTQ